MIDFPLAGFPKAGFPKADFPKAGFPKAGFQRSVDRGKRKTNTARIFDPRRRLSVDGFIYGESRYLL